MAIADIPIKLASVLVLLLIPAAVTVAHKLRWHCSLGRITPQTVLFARLTA